MSFQRKNVYLLKEKVKRAVRVRIKRGLRLIKIMFERLLSFDL